MKQQIFSELPLDCSPFIVGEQKDDHRSMMQATAEEVAQFEELIDCSLPSDYKEFLSNCNGGTIDPVRFSDVVNADVIGKLSNNENYQTKEIAVEYFHTLDKKTITTKSLQDLFYLPNALLSYAEYAAEDVNFSPPEGTLIPFASTSPWGVFLACDGVYAGKVIVYDNQVQADSPIDYFGLIANSFNEFMLSLYFNPLTR